MSEEIPVHVEEIGDYEKYDEMNEDHRLRDGSRVKFIITNGVWHNVVKK